MEQKERDLSSFPFIDIPLLPQSEFNYPSMPE